MRANLKPLHDFAAIGELAETTVQLLCFQLEHDLSRDRSERLAQVEQVILNQARDYLGRVREGFVLSVRSADVADRGELRYLLERVLFDWDAFSRELGLQEEGPASPGAAQLERVRNQLLAFGMAAVALGVLPRLPTEAITFPKSYRHPPTYADIPVPASPGEMLHRIEELERTLWQLMVEDLDELLQRRYEPVRRTYGFFESSAWLARREGRRLGLKRPRQ